MIIEENILLTFSLGPQSYHTECCTLDTCIKCNLLLPYRRDTCFDAHLFRRLFCLYHVMLCARSDDVTARFFVCKYIKHCFTLSRKNKCKVRDSKVRNNQICQCIAVWSNFLKFKITHFIEAKFPPS